MRDEDYEGLGNVLLLGRYEEERLGDLVATYDPAIAFFPNQWPETFSYTLSHALALGLWPVVTDIGAPAERVRAAAFGTVIEADCEVETLVSRLTEIASARIAGGPGDGREDADP